MAAAENEEKGRTKNLRIGEVLQEMGYVSARQIENALAYQKDHPGVRMGDALVALGYITERQMLEALASRMHMRMVNINDISVDMEAVAKVPKALAKKNLILPVSLENGMLSVLTYDPTNFYALEDIRQLTGCFLDVGLSERAPLEKAIEYYYAEIDARKAAVQVNLNQPQPAVDEKSLEEDGDTPVINLLDTLLRRAYSTGASDIHIEPFEENTRIRMRVDGVISDFVTVPTGIHGALIARIKILSDLDIAEKRLPQDGHFRFAADGQMINLRVSLIPTVFGEKAVLRLLASNVSIDRGERFGMDDDSYALLQQMLQAPNGIIYLTGPTGSGKTTTLYMILEALSRRELNISTIEDPVEKNLPRVNQMQVNDVSGLTFEAGLRALLRQDPDVIMVGETRDAQTASISVRAAITGHVVFSTLHTNDAVSSIVRLKDMGVENYLIASSLTGIVAQRLVRKLCPYCSQEYPLSPAEEKFMGPGVKTARRKVGCHLCNYSGYQGRIAVHEVFRVDKTVRDLIGEDAPVQQITDYAVQKLGMKLLKTTGISLVKQGITSVEEILKIAHYAE